MKKYVFTIVIFCIFVVCLYVGTGKAEDKIIVIDAGHGGLDPGMVGSDGLEEKGINLEIAGKLKELLEKESYSVVMTREKDEGLYDSGTKNKKLQDLKRRILLIQKTAPILTVSIHQNSYSDPAVRGPQVFYFKNSEKSQALAHFLQNSLNGSLSMGKPRKEKGNDSYYLLKKSPGILNIVECGFLTNPDEARLLQKKEYQWKIAEALCEGICDYLDKIAEIGRKKSGF